MSGNVYSITERLRNRNPQEGEDDQEDHDHYLFSHSSEDIARAQGFRLVYRMSGGFTRPKKGAIEAFEFPSLWHHCTEGENRSIIKGFNLFPVLPDQLTARVGQSVTKWKDNLKQLVSGLTWDIREAESQLSQFASSRSTNIHPIVAQAEIGDLISINSQAAVVLSNAQVNRRHRYGVMMVAPLRANNGSMNHALTVPVGSHRVAFEEFQSCELYRSDEVRRIPGNLPAESCSSVYARLAALGLIRSPNNVSKPSNEDLVSYLHAAAIDRNGGSVIRLIDNEPTPPTPEAPPTYHRPKRNKGRGAPGLKSESLELIAHASATGYAGTANLELWQRDSSIFIRLVDVHGGIGCFDQIGLFAAEPIHEFLVEDVRTSESWRWERRLGELTRFVGIPLLFYAIAPGITLSLRALIQLDSI